MGASFIPAMLWVPSWENPSPLLGGDFDVLCVPPLDLGTAALIAAPWSPDRHGGSPGRYCRQGGPAKLLVASSAFPMAFAGLMSLPVALENGLHGGLRGARDSQGLIPLW